MPGDKSSEEPSDYDWMVEFSNIISCTRCNETSCKKILRDHGENVPQPGFIGSKFRETRILLVGQNPGIPKAERIEKDNFYTAALRRMRDEASLENWRNLQRTLLDFVPDWPVQRNYFPLSESGLTLSEIAYCNIVRCRTKENSAPSSNMVLECVGTHFDRWLEMLEPRAIIFIGKWAYDKGMHFAHKRNIPCDFMNRERSLSSSARVQNRQRVVALIQSIVSNKTPNNE